MAILLMKENSCLNKMCICLFYIVRDMFNKLAGSQVYINVNKLAGSQVYSKVSFLVK